MADDDPISPVDGVRAEAADRVDRAPAPPTSAAARPTGARGVPAAPASLGDGLVHEQLDHPVRSPRGVDVRAEVHDSAAHGNRIAAAIERAQLAQPTDRAQQLGGAAASAGSGQAAQVDRSRMAEPDPGDHDPLRPIDPVVPQARDARPHRREHDGPDRRDA